MILFLIHCVNHTYHKKHAKMNGNTNDSNEILFLIKSDVSNKIYNQSSICGMIHSFNHTFKSYFICLLAKNFLISPLRIQVRYISKEPYTTAMITARPAWYRLSWIIMKQPYKVHKILIVKNVFMTFLFPQIEIQMLWI